MPRMVFGEAEMDIPKPLFQIVADQVQAMFDGRCGVTAAQVASALHRQPESLNFHLRKAQRLGLIGKANDGTWVPL